LNFDKILNEKHAITSIAGIEARQIKSDVGSKTLLGYDDDLQIFSKLINWEFLNGLITDFSGSRGIGFRDPSFVSTDKNRYISFFGNASYTFDRKYTFTVSGKIEQASIFGLDARLRLNKLGSAGLAWNITNEEFFNVKAISNLKLRASYGVNGNVRRGITTENVFVSGVSSYTDPSLDLSIVGNRDLTQEDNYVTNVGMDFSLFKYRLNGSVDYYNKQSKNLLAAFRTPASLGYTNQNINNGEILNNGIEVTLGGDILRAKDFSWNGQILYTYNKSKVVKYQTSTETAAQIISNPYVKGEEIKALLSYQWAGLATDGQPQVFNENGDIVNFQTTILSPEALVVTGSAIPNHFGSFNNTFNYKGLSLGVFLTYKLGHKFRKPTFGFSDPTITSFTRSEDLEKVWKVAGDEANTNVPRFPTRTEFENGKFSNWTNYYYLSNALIEDASFIRIRDIYLNYKLADKWLKKTPFTNIELRTQVRNLGFLWLANKYDVDPDVLPLSGGLIESAQNPDTNLALSRPGMRPTPELTFGVNLRF
jgi:hypothetical protein